MPNNAENEKSFVDGFGYLKVNMTLSEQMKNIFEEQNRIISTASEFRSKNSIIVCIIKHPKQIKSFFFSSSVLRPFQDYFSSYETGQSVGGAKTGEPREKPPDTPAAELGLSHVARAGLEPTPDTAVR